jgi:hypothetical protein
LSEPNACKLGVKCPVAQTNVNVVSFPIAGLSVKPAFPFGVKFEIVADDRSQDYTCLEFSVTYVGS